jgi:Tol biopolymer transport system component
MGQLQQNFKLGVDRRLTSWKEIAAHLGCDARTAQRWEKTEGLPVHRHVHSKSSSIYAYADELDAWRQSRSPEAPASAPPTVAADGKKDRLVLVLAGAAIVAALAVWVAGRPERVQESLWAPVPLTSYLGNEFAPDFSPDGSQVVFNWNGEHQDNYDIYVLAIGSQRPVRLTTDPAEDCSPAWSPDGRSIAFLRGHPAANSSIMVMDAGGGSERKIADLARGSRTRVRDLDWSSDGKWLVFSGAPGIFAVSVETGERFPLTFPQPGQGDFYPAVSHDGQRIAFARDSGLGVSKIYLLPLGHDFRPAGEPRELPLAGVGRSLNVSPRWTAGDDGLVFVSDSGASRFNHLWKVGISGRDRPSLLTGLGDRLTAPAISPKGRRLAYARRQYDSNIWRIELGQGRASAPTQFIASTRLEDSPQFSSDGRHIAFVSDRSGTEQIWTCDRDGSNPVQITNAERGVKDSERWSPDGRSLAFASNVEGQSDIYVVPSAGGTPVRLTKNLAADLPSWSPDGRWIYFYSNRTGSFQLWRMPASGGPPVQVTLNGGVASELSPDGRWLYFSKSDAPVVTVWRMPAAGGAETIVAESVLHRGFAASREGLYVLRATGAETAASLEFLPGGTGKPTAIATINRRVMSSLTLSPDARTLLYVQADQDNVDLMLVEGFH